MTELETERLELRRWRPNDLDDYAAIVADPRVMRFMGAPSLDRTIAWRNIALFIGHRELRGYTQSAVTERGTGRLIGRAGLWQPEGWLGLEAVWLLEAASWGRGYGRELGRAIRDHAFRELDAGHLISLIHPDNTASIRVAESIGSRYERDTDVGGDRHLVFGQRRAR